MMRLSRGTWKERMERGGGGGGIGGEMWSLAGINACYKLLIRRIA